MVHLRVKYFEAKMKKRLAIATISVLLLLSALFILPKLVDMNRYKGELVTLLSERTGLDFEIKGDISLTLLPDFGVTLRDMTVSGNVLPDTVDTASIHIDEFILKLKTIPLLKGQLAFDAIILKHPILSVLLSQTETDSKAEKVKKNKADMASENDKLKEVVNEVASADHKKPLGPTGYALAIKEFRIYQGEVLLKNAKWSAPVHINDINVKASLDATSAPFSIDGIVPYGNKEHHFSVGGSLLLNDKQYVAEQFILHLDDMKGYGKVDVDMRSSIPDVTVLLNVERIDLDPFIGTSTETVADTSAGAKKTPDTVAWSKDPVSFAVLQAMNAHINIGIGAIHYKAFKCKDIASNTHFGHGRLTSELKAGLVEGQLSAKTSIDATGNVPAIDQSLVLEGVDIASLPEISSLQKVFLGTLNASMGLTSMGSSPFEWVNHLGGEGILNVMQGKIKGVNLKDMAKNMTGAFQSAGKEDLTTEFDKIHSSFAINQGILHNDDLAIEMGALRLLGAGQLNVPELTVDYRLVSKIESGGGSDGQIAIPILIKGSLLHPQFSPDVVSSVLDVVKDPQKAEHLLKDLKENLKGGQGSIKNNLKQELKGMLPNAF